MAYSTKVIDHYENPRNVGSFDKGDDSVGTGADRFGDDKRQRS
jgi:nitrogen fixation NifU-like protein